MERLKVCIGGQQYAKRLPRFACAEFFAYCRLPMQLPMFRYLAPYSRGKQRFYHGGSAGVSVTVVMSDVRLGVCLKTAHPCAEHKDTIEHTVVSCICRISALSECDTNKEVI